MPPWCRAAVLGLVVTSACSSGGGDLNQLFEKPKPVGAPIAAAAPGSPTAIADGQTIKAQGVVVTAVDTYDETKDGKGVGDIYVQDPIQSGAKGTPWSGLKLYRPSKNPPDLDLVPGHGVDLEGAYAILAGPPGSTPFDAGLVLVEAVTPTVTLTFEGRPPAPIDLTYDDVKDPKVAQQYQSRLVRFKNVKLTTDFTGKRLEAKTDGPFGMAAKFFPIHETPGLNAKSGTTFKSVTGIFDFFYSYKLCPRSAADVEL
jgi:hypothetical protein